MATLTEQTVPASVAPADPRKPGNDPFKTWAELHRQLGLVVPKKILHIRQLSQTLLGSVRL